MSPDQRFSDSKDQGPARIMSPPCEETVLGPASLETGRPSKAPTRQSLAHREMGFNRVMDLLPLTPIRCLRPCPSLTQCKPKLRHESRAAPARSQAIRIGDRIGATARPRVGVARKD